MTAVYFHRVTRQTPTRFWINPVTPEVLNELITGLPDFKRGYAANGIHVGEYDEFGPVELFRGSFVKSWRRVLDVIKERRQVLTG